MNKPKTTGKNKKDQFSRDQLLGTIDKAFTLGDSEIVAECIIEFILKMVMNKVRLHYVESLMNDFVVCKTLNILNSLVDMEMGTKDPDSEKELTSDDNKDNFEGNFEVIKPKIDAWASNKAKIMIVKPNEVVALAENTNLNTSHGGSKALLNLLTNISVNTQNNKNNKQTAHQPGKKQEGNQRYNDTKDIRDLKSGLAPSYLERNSSNLSSQLMSRTSNMIGSQLQMGTSSQLKKQEGTTNKENQKANAGKYSFSPPNAKKKEEEIEQYPLEDENDNNEPIDELELIKEKTLRTYFKEKELEKERKKKVEKELEEVSKEEEKRRKKLLEEMSKKPFIYDFEGKILNVKPPDVAKLYYPPEPDANIAEKKIELSPEGRREKKERRDKKKTIKISSKNVIPQRIAPSDDLPQRFYQPDPLVSHVIPAGVTMEFYGVKKEGGKFPEVEGRLSQGEFYSLLNMYKPASNFFAYDSNYRNAQNHNKESEKIPEEDEQFEKESIKLSKLFNMTTDEDKFDSKNAKNKVNYLKQPLKPNSKQALYEMPKKQQAEKIEKIKALKEFNLEKMNKIDDDRLYDIFNMYDDKNGMSVMKAKSMAMPKNVHVKIEKELGVMKKYPRERVAKDILAITGKIKIVPSANNQPINKQVKKQVTTSIYTTTTDQGFSPRLDYKK